MLSLFAVILLCLVLPPRGVAAEEAQPDHPVLTLETGETLAPISNEEFLRALWEENAYLDSSYGDALYAYYIPGSVDAFSLSFETVEFTSFQGEARPDGSYQVTRDIFYTYRASGDSAIFKEYEELLGINAYDCEFMTAQGEIAFSDDPDDFAYIRIAFCWENDPADSGPILTPQNGDPIGADQDRALTIRESFQNFSRYVYYVPENVDLFSIHYEGYSCDEVFYPGSVIDKSSIYKNDIKDPARYDDLLGNEPGKYDYIEVMIYLEANIDKRIYCTFCWEKTSEIEEPPGLTGASAANAALFTPCSAESSAFSMVLDKGRTSGSFHFTANETTAEAYLYADAGYTAKAEALPPADGGYTVPFDANEFRLLEGEHLGQTKYIGIANAGGDETRFSVTAYQRRSAAGEADGFWDEPDRVAGFLRIGSPNTGPHPEESLLGGTAVNLAGFGSYITYYYEDPITDNPNNPCGIDFLVYGGESFPAAANVLVSEDGTAWYTLAGAAHYDDSTDWNRSVTYARDEATGGTLIDGTLYAGYPYITPEDYPLHPFASGEEASITLTGLALADGAIPVWDYCAGIQGNRFTENARSGSGYDLAWAVDGSGLPVDLSGAEIHYIKIQAASCSDENSVEVSAVTRARAGSSPVGETAAPVSVVASGTEIVFDEKHTATAAVTAPFTVNITAPNGANVYINSDQGVFAAYSAMPAHQILRIVVQEGTKEPWIGYIALTEGTGPGAALSHITFDAAGGTVDGQDGAVTYASDMPDSAKRFPVPVREGYTFQGWYDADGNRYDAYTEELPGELKLTARWEYSQSDPHPPVSPPGPAGSSGSSEPSAGTGPEYAAIRVEISANSKGEAAAQVTGSMLRNAIAAVKSYSLDAVVIAPEVTGTATQFSVSLPRSAVQELVRQTGAALRIETPAGQADIPHDTLSALLDAAQGSDLTLTVTGQDAGQARDLLDRLPETVAKNQREDCVITETLLSSGQKPITGWGGRPLTLYLPVNQLFEAGKSYTVYQIGEDGTPEQLTGRCVRRDQTLSVRITATHSGAFIALPDPAGPAPLPFADVQAGDWYYDDVAYACRNGLFAGVSGDTFAPGASMTRAMLVTVLWRMKGEPAAAREVSFADVAANQWYTEAVAWASGAGIVFGADLGFEPDNSVTREQIAVILYRFARHKGWDVSGGADLSGFADGETVSGWAVQAMQWACAEQLVLGRDGSRLDPLGQASRAEAAALLRRFLEKQNT